MGRKKTVKQDALDFVKATKRPKGKILSASGDFVKFEKPGDTFTGTTYGKEVIRQKNKGNQKKGDVMGYEFVTEDGEVVLIGASWTIKKSIGAVPAADLKKGVLLYIEFQGQKKLTAGRKVNQFEVILVK